MALQVWLPLDGSVIQQGCASVNAELHGPTVTPGKIGNCYQFDGSDDYIELTGEDLYSIIKGGDQPFSIAMWVYHDDATRAILFGDYGLSGAINFNIELSTGHNVRFYWNGSPDVAPSAMNVGAATWTHIAITYSGNQIRMYKNGISVYTRDGALTEKTKTSGSYYLGRDSRTGSTTLNGRLNDFRIYDHCLSTLEVHELAQALIIHYKLQGGTDYTVDDISYLEDSSGYGHAAACTGSFGSASGAKRYSSNATYLSSTSSKATVSNLVTSGMGSYTFAWYSQQSTYTNVLLWGFADGIRLGAILSGNLWFTNDGTSNPLYNPGTTTQVTAPATNTWYHWAMVGDGSTCKVYKDGALWAQAKTYKGISGTTLVFNGFDSTSSYTSTFYINDFRMYATALSQDDIKFIMNGLGRYDNKKQIHGFQLDECNVSTTNSTVLEETNISSLPTSTTSTFQWVSYTATASPAPAMQTKHVTLTRNIRRSDLFEISPLGTVTVKYPYLKISSKNGSYTRSSWRVTGYSNGKPQYSSTTSQQYYYYLSFYIYLRLFDEAQNYLGSLTVAGVGSYSSGSSRSYSTQYETIGSNYSAIDGYASKLLDLSSSEYPTAKYGQVSVEYVGSYTAQSAQVRTYNGSSYTYTSVTHSSVYAIHAKPHKMCMNKKGQILFPIFIEDETANLHLEPNLSAIAAQYIEI